MSNYESRLRVLLAFLAIILITMPLGSAVAQENNCTTGDVQMLGSNSFSMEIIITNTDTLAGFQIPFSFDYAGIPINCESVSFVGGDCRDFGFHDTKVDNQTKMVYLAATNNGSIDDDVPPLTPGRHLIAKVYFSVERTDEERSVNFQVTQFPDERLDYSFLMWTPQAEEVPATFSFSNLRIK
jgi:hypothetical protein